MRSSFIGLAPVGNARDADKLRRVIDDVHDTPITNPHAPLILEALELFATCWTWDGAERLQLFDDVGQHIMWQRFQLSFAEGLTSTE